VGKNCEECNTGFCTHKKSTTILLRRIDFNLKLILNYIVPNGQQKIYPNELKPIMFLRIDFFMFQLHKSTYNIAFWWIPSFSQLRPLTAITLAIPSYDYPEYTLICNKHITLKSSIPSCDNLLIIFYILYYYYNIIYYILLIILYILLYYVYYILLTL